MNNGTFSKSARAAVFLSLLLTAQTTLPATTPVSQGVGLCRFVLHNYQLPAASEQAVNQIVGDLLQRHAEVFGFQPAADFHVRIRIFGKQDEYLRFARTNRSASGAELTGLNATNLAGYYSTGGNEVVTWRQRDPSYLANNILHECSHAIMHSHFRYLPIWLDEGCAVYFSFPRSMQDASDVRLLKRRWAQLEQWRLENSLPSLWNFLNLSHEDFRKGDLNRNYAVSWSLFQFLMSTPENRKAMNEMLRRIQNTESPSADCAGELGKLYPGGLEKFEKDWREWIRVGAANAR